MNELILPQYTLYGHGRWAIRLKETQEFIGWCGLKKNPMKNEVNLGYRLKRKFWQQGFATEAAQASLSYGFTTLNLTRIIARAHKENHASMHVIKKCGMKYIRVDIIDELPLFIYEAIRPS